MFQLPTPKELLDRFWEVIDRKRRERESAEEAKQRRITNLADTLFNISVSAISKAAEKDAVYLAEHGTLPPIHLHTRVQVELDKLAGNDQDIRRNILMLVNRRELESKGWVVLRFKSVGAYSPPVWSGLYGRYIREGLIIGRVKGSPGERGAEIRQRGPTASGLPD